MANEKTPKELSTLEVLIQKLNDEYAPCARGESDEYITSNDLFDQLQAFYPSESYTVEIIVDTLILTGWQSYYDSDAQAYYWQVKKREIT